MQKKPKNRHRERHLSKAGICFEALEPRLLLSGSWGAIVDGPGAESQADTHDGLILKSVVSHADAGFSGAGNAQVNLTPECGRVDLLSRAPALNALGNPVHALDASSASNPAASVNDVTAPMSLADNKVAELHADALDTTKIHELVLVNANVADYDGLIADINGDNSDRAIEVVVLDWERDGIQQVSDILADRSDISAVHVITHGSDGSVVFHADAGNSAAVNGRVPLTPGSGRVDLLSQAPVLNPFGNVVPALDASPASIPSAPVTGDTPATPLTDQSDAASNTETIADTVESVVRRELVFVNDNVAEYEILINGIRESDTNRNIEIVVLDADRDGIQQVSDILAERSDLSAVHVIAHGSDGQINLGNSWLNSTTLQQNSDAVAGWGNALTETGDILFYGCDIAADSDGQSLLDDIAELTGADVAASDDNTGHAIFGADWDLEYNAGAIETGALFSQRCSKIPGGIC